MKYADAGAILKVIASTMAVLPVTVISSVYLDAKLNLHFVLGMLTAFPSLTLYFTTPYMPTRMECAKGLA